jgi:hypothetical protein
VKLLTQRFIRIVLLVAIVALPAVAAARIGVGVGTGKIVVDKELRPGAVYNLPSLPVVNTGDVPMEYGVEVTFHADQEGSWPDVEWFTFHPQQFYLEPGQAQAVAVTLRLPVRTRPGQYFAFLEAYPIVADAGPGASIGIAAAARLEFTVTPANIWQGMYYRLSSLLAEYAPWTYVVLAVFGVSFLIAVFRRYFSINIGVKKQ